MSYPEELEQRIEWDCQETMIFIGKLLMYLKADRVDDVTIALSDLEQQVKQIGWAVDGWKSMKECRGAL